MKSSFLKRFRLAPAFGLLVLTFLIFISLPGLSRAAPVTLEEKMPDFTLPVYQGGEVNLSALHGKNVMIVFPRGHSAPGAWCTVCDYKYAELIDLEKASQLRKKYNLEILFVFPYDRDTVTSWLAALPAQLGKIRGIKFPPEPAKLDEKAKKTMMRYREVFPKDPSVPKEQIFPILIDGDRKVSKNLDLFRTEWAGSKVDQNVPTTFILDRNGIVRFKYFSQSTIDRPGYEYLIEVLDCMTDGKKR